MLKNKILISEEMSDLQQQIIKLIQNDKINKLTDIVQYKLIADRDDFTKTNKEIENLLRQKDKLTVPTDSNSLLTYWSLVEPQNLLKRIEQEKTIKSLPIEAQKNLLYDDPDDLYAINLNAYQILQNNIKNLGDYQSSVEYTKGKTSSNELDYTPDDIIRLVAQGKEDEQITSAFEEMLHKGTVSDNIMHMLSQKNPNFVLDLVKNNKLQHLNDQSKITLIYDDNLEVRSDMLEALWPLLSEEDADNLFIVSDDSDEQKYEKYATILKSKFLSKTNVDPKAIMKALKNSNIGYKVLDNIFDEYEKDKFLSNFLVGEDGSINEEYFNDLFKQNQISNLVFQHIFRKNRDFILNKIKDKTITTLPNNIIKAMLLHSGSDEPVNQEVFDVLYGANIISNEFLNEVLAEQYPEFIFKQLKNKKINKEDERFRKSQKIFNTIFNKALLKKSEEDNSKVIDQDRYNSLLNADVAIPNKIVNKILDSMIS